MYTLETGLESEMGTTADDLESGDLGVVLSLSLLGHIVLKVNGYLIDLHDPHQVPWAGHCNLRVRRLSRGESITLTV